MHCLACGLTSDSEPFVAPHCNIHRRARLLRVSCGSKRAHTAVLSPRMPRALLKRTIVTRDYAQMRCVLALVFLSRQSEELLCALTDALKHIEPNWSFRHAVFQYLQLAEISGKFPSHPALYDLVATWAIPSTLAAAWLNDIQELRALKEKGCLEPNVRTYGNYAAVAAFCVTTDEACARSLLDNGADMHADIRPAEGARSSRFPRLIIHDLGQRHHLASPAASWPQGRR